MGNGKLYARLKDTAGNVGEVATLEITYYDALVPSITKVTATDIQPEQITVTATATDSIPTEESGKSEIKEYKFYQVVSGQNIYKGTSTTGIYIFTGLTEETSYTFKVVAVDNAGNESNISDSTAQVTKRTTKKVYYADIDDDGKVDGVIYADQSIGGSGQWGKNNDIYTIPTKTIQRKYYTRQTGYKGSFGIGDVIAPVDKNDKTGEPRYYVMALKDFTTTSCTRFYWYYVASSEKIPDYNIVTKTGFGEGKQNTANMISAWNDSRYGEQNDEDVWKWIQTEVKNGWFVPSKDEWTTFAGELDLTWWSSNLAVGMSEYYWSSSLSYNWKAWNITFVNSLNWGEHFVIDGKSAIRLTTTF